LTLRVRRSPVNTELSRFSSCKQARRPRRGARRRRGSCGVGSDETPEVVVGAVVVPDEDLGALGGGGAADAQDAPAVGGLDAEVAVGAVAQPPAAVVGGGVGQ